MKDEEWEELTKTVRAFPLEPPVGTVSQLISNGYLNTEIQIYSVSQVPREVRDNFEYKIVGVYCTACGCMSYMEYCKLENPDKYCSYYGTPDDYGFIDVYNEVRSSYQLSVCPQCGTGRKVILRSRIRNYINLESDDALSIHNINGHAVLLKWNINKICDKDGYVSYISYPAAASVLIGRKLYRAKGRGYILGNDTNSIYREWEPLRTPGNDIGDMNVRQIVPFSPETLDGTEAENAAVYQYLEDINGRGRTRYPVSWLVAWLKYPQLENLVKSGIYNYTDEVFQKCSSFSSGYYTERYGFSVKDIRRYLDVKKKKPHEMMRCRKEDVPLSEKMKLTHFCLYSLSGREKERISAEDIEKLTKLADTGKMIEMLSGDYGDFKPTVKRLTNYIFKNCPGTNKNLLSDLYDTWKMCMQVYGSVPEEFRFPAKLEKMHTKVMVLCKVNEKPEISKKIEKRAKRLEQYTYEKDGLFIRPCGSHAELILEGKILNHCVATYAESVANGKTSIFFIRRADEPEVPFYTLEYRDGKVIQNRGKNNCSETKEVVQFKNEWLEFIAKGLMNSGNRDCA